MTARTFHTGVTRKRIVPVQLPNEWSSNETEFRNAKGRRAGKLICTNQNGNSLAMLRVENIDKPIKLGNWPYLQPKWPQPTPPSRIDHAFL